MIHKIILTKILKSFKKEGQRNSARFWIRPGQVS